MSPQKKSDKDEKIHWKDDDNRLSILTADQMRENVIGTISIPMDLIGGFLINNNEYTVPLASEEKEVFHMATEGASLTRKNGGFHARTTEQIMIGQIQLLNIKNHEKIKSKINANKKTFLNTANTASKTRKAVDLQVKSLDSAAGAMMLIELYVDVRDSAGMNIVDTMCELISPMIEELSGGYVNMNVVSNLSDRRMVFIETTVKNAVLGGNNVITDIISAYQFAKADPYRAVTHNKGIMNGIVGVLLATGNDTRAVEAGAHAYASLSGMYKPLSSWTTNDEGDLKGTLEMPLAAGIIGGGAVSAHPTARKSLEVLGVTSAKELIMVIGSVGLACNLSALYNLVTKGIKNIQP